MRASIRVKVMGIPLFLVLLTVSLLVAVSVWVVNDMWHNQIAELASSQEGMAEKSLKSLEAEALSIAAFASEVPGVEDAYALAVNGQEDEGRKLLRASFDRIHKRVTTVLGIKDFKIHFHLPPAKSFLRIWRAAGKKDGGDDISSFRQTVLKVNKDKKQVAGIEIGRGGFAVRGLVPVTSAGGAHLGSVEALLDLNKIFKTAKPLESDNVAVYMLTSELEIARKIKEKNPPVTGNMARIFSSNPEKTDPFIKEKLLAGAMHKMVNTEISGQILTAIPIKDFAGDTKGALVFVRDASKLVAKIHFLRWSLFIGGIVLLAGLSLFLYLSTGTIIKRLNKIIGTLHTSGGSMVSACGEISGSSQELAEGASEQAASLEETSSSLEEMASMTRQNAEHATQTATLMNEASTTISDAENSMSKLTASMEEISKASEETSKIIKTIDEIAFQTNLLALNAAVEAARAGEAGAGFAVVADEVRSLAMRAAEAAKNTAEMIEGTVQKVKGGSDLATETSTSFSRVSEIAGKINSLVSEIAAASNEQAQGIDQVNKAVTEIDTVTQRNAANAEESASAAQELNSLASQMQNIVEDLIALVTGGQSSTEAITETTPARTTKTPERSQGTFALAAPKKHESSDSRPKKEKKQGTTPEEMIPLDEDDFEDF